MGQARQRGTFEQRLAAAQERDAAARMERKRIAAEREAEWRRLDEEVRERRAKAQEARRKERIAAGLDPDDPPEPRQYSAFGRRREVMKLRAGISVASIAVAMAACMVPVPSRGGKQGGQQ